MGVDLEAPDHTTLSRRSQHLDVALNLVPVNEPIHLIVDSTGLSIVGEGEWAAVKHGGRGKRGWKKLHLGVDRSGVIVAGALTDGNADDAKTALELIDEVEDEITSVTADPAYDTIAIYNASAARGAKAVVPQVTSSTRSRRRRSRSSARDRTIMRVKEIGYRQWKKELGYHRQVLPLHGRTVQSDEVHQPARVENTFFRYKTIIGPGLRARHPKAQDAEAMIACNILNTMIALARPESSAICV
jgi:IS5 family transposase